MEGDNEYKGANSFAKGAGRGGAEREASTQTGETSGVEMKSISVVRGNACVVSYPRARSRCATGRRSEGRRG